MNLRVESAFANPRDDTRTTRKTDAGIFSGYLEILLILQNPPKAAAFLETFRDEREAASAEASRDNL